VRRFTGVLAATIAVLCLAAGTMIGYSLALSQVREAAAEATVAREDLDRLARAHETLQERNWILYLEAEELRGAEASNPTPTQPGVYADGTYEVGTDIPPGTYRGEVTGEFGYWARLRNTSGMVSGIVANDVVRGPFVITIVSSDAAVELRRVTLRASE
jgi:hypothetical protein